MNKITRRFEGEVVAVCKSNQHGYPTYPQDYVIVNWDGIVGDAHAGPMRESFRNPGTFKPNDRPFSIISWEVINALNEQFRSNIGFGDFNEQLILKGLGDLGWVAIGSIISFLESSVQLRVVDYAVPCRKLNEHNNNSLLAKNLILENKKNKKGDAYSRRGILAEVINPGILRPSYKAFIKNGRQ